MDAVFTLPYSEFAIAELLGGEFKAKSGYSVLVPVSRTEKGYDLALSQRLQGMTKCVTFQVKASRTYAGTAPKRKSSGRRFRYYTWFNRFEVPAQADFVVLFGLYSLADGSGRKRGRTWWNTLVLLFTQEEMRQLFASIKTKKTGSPERMFSFGFDDADCVYLTRGNESGSLPDYSQHLFDRRKELIAKVLSQSFANSSVQLAGSSVTARAEHGPRQPAGR